MALAPAGPYGRRKRWDWVQWGAEDFASVALLGAHQGDHRLGFAAFRLKRTLEFRFGINVLSGEFGYTLREDSNGITDCIGALLGFRTTALTMRLRRR